MAVTQTHIETSGSTTDATSFATGSRTPTANRLQLIGVTSRTGSGTPVEPTVTGCNLTWVKIDTRGNGTSSFRLTVFRALGASPTTGTLTIDFGSETQQNARWSWCEYADVDTSGTDGSGAIVQSVTNADSSGSATGLTVTLGAFGSSSNATYGAFAQAGNSTFTAGTNFNIGGQSAGATPALSGCSEFYNANDTTVDVTASGSGRMLGLAAEIKTAPADRYDFGTEPANTVAGATMANCTVRAEDAAGNLDATYAGNVTVALTTAGGATLSGTLTRTASGGTATFTDLSVNKTGTYTLTATGSLTSTESASFNITPGTASLATSQVTASPTAILANSSDTSTITIQLRDANSNDLVASGGTVTVATTLGTLGSVTDNTNGSYAATLTAGAVAGTATVTAKLDGNDITDNATVVLDAVETQPTVSAVGTPAFDLDGSVTPVNPAHASGDILILAGTCRFTTSETALAAPSGWTQFPGSPQSLMSAGASDSIMLALFWKRATSGSETNPTITDGGVGGFIGGVVICVQGCIASGNPHDVTSGGTQVGPSISATGATATVSSCLVMAVVATSRDATSTTNFSGWANASLTSVTEIVDSVSSVSTGGGLGIATGGKASAGAFGATTVTSTGTTDHAFITVALRPNPGAPTNAQIQLAWDDLSATEDNFSLERKTGAGAYGVIASPSAGTTSYTDTVAGGQTYTYRIRAVNQTGNSAYSNEDAVVVP